ncbi:hypothetical protein BDZ94DRAFT_1227367 [Collybia nuda]|uniref:Uncharacterized protein n=1 Tax=Collybia nuda TaxID=64659 RepID=A0A9P5XY82_9AGAR|nr:hypothetical protein BDZ94DRAFT_1227367 [Collybia nuda]
MNFNATTISSFESTSNQRNVWNIVWSCLMTVLACTWVSVHPNIPAISNSTAVIYLRRTWLMLCGLIAPEIIIFWAMKQWYCARKIEMRHKERGWTMTHGYFLQMGGFVLGPMNNDGHPLGVLELEEMHSEGNIEWPDITESEIKDKSKGDALSKGIATLQTSWFLVQCIGRGSSGLAITELEILTLAFATLNVVTYFFWWNKPVDVRLPHTVTPKPNTISVSFPPPPPSLINISSSEHGPPSRVPTNPGAMQWASQIMFPLMPVMQGLLHTIRRFMGQTLKPDRAHIFCLAKASPNRRTLLQMTAACAILGSIFGGIHCIAWSFQFPSHQEQISWRISSMVITCSPALLVPLSATLQCTRSGLKGAHLCWSRYFWMFAEVLRGTALVLTVLIYITARLVLIIQACMALRKLSPGALESMAWTSFVPHF